MEPESTKEFVRVGRAGGDELVSYGREGSEVKRGGRKTEEVNDLGGARRVVSQCVGDGEVTWRGGGN